MDNHFFLTKQSKYLLVEFFTSIVCCYEPYFMPYYFTEIQFIVEKYIKLCGFIEGQRFCNAYTFSTSKEQIALPLFRFPWSLSKWVLKSSALLLDFLQRSHIVYFFWLVVDIFLTCGIDNLWSNSIPFHRYSYVLPYANT